MTDLQHEEQPDHPEGRIILSNIYYLILGPFAFQELIFFGLLSFKNKEKDKGRSANGMPDIKIKNYLTFT
jgi:hypothetical protein